MLLKGNVAKIKTRADLRMLRSKSTIGFFRYGGYSVTRGCTFIYFFLRFKSCAFDGSF